jgi:TRAP-type C4-dicarboxylate transport system substrate-binding protein
MTKRLTLFAKKLATVIVFAQLLPATAFAEKVLRYSDHEPLGGMRTQFIKEVFFAAVQQESNGRLKIEDHWDGKIAGPYEALAAAGKGVAADMSMVVPEYTANDLPLHQIFKGFPVGPTGGQQVSFFRRVYADAPEFSEELAKNNVVPMFLATGYPLAFYSTQPLKSLEGIKGETWRTASFWHRDFLRNAGARPVSIPWGPAVYTALQSRALDGLVVNVDSGYLLKVHETAPHVLVSKDLWLGHLYIVVMNKDTWNGLTPEDQRAIQRAATIAYRSLGQVMDKHFDTMVNDLKNGGANVRPLDSKEVGAWQGATSYEAVQAAWVTEQEAKGVRAAGPVLEKVRRIMNNALQPRSESPSR